MRPITVFTAIILGSCLAISICLIAVWILLTLVSFDAEFTERAAYDLGKLPSHIAIFIPLTCIATAAFISSQKQMSYWWSWQLLLWGALTLVGFYYVGNMTN